MPQKLVTYCDVCGITKGENNHWFMARAKPNFFETFPWSEKATNHDGSLTFLCSLNCLMKAVTRSMQGRPITQRFDLEDVAEHTDKDQPKTNERTT